MQLIKYEANKGIVVVVGIVVVDTITKVRCSQSTHCRACFNNNTTTLKRFYSETMINDREVSLR